MLAHVRHFPKWIIILFLVFTLSGCAGKVKLSEDALRIRKIKHFVTELRNLYEQRDARILDLISQDDPAGREEMGKAILGDFERFHTLSLAFFVDRIEIDGENVNISIHWNGTWKDSKKSYQEGGTMVLITSYGDAIRITTIRGDSPFGIANIL